MDGRVLKEPETVLVSVGGPRRLVDVAYLVGSVAKERGGM